MNNGLIHRYKIIGIICICCSIVFGSFLIWSPVYMEYYDKNVNYAAYMAGDTGSYPIYIDGIRIIEYKLLHQVGNLANEPEIILVGSSNTRLGLVHNYSFKDGYSLKNFGMSSSNPYSDKLMLNYIRLEGNRNLSSSDVVVFNLFFGYFMEKNYLDDFTKQSLDMFGTYTIDSSANITGKMSTLQRFYLDYICRYHAFLETFHIAEKVKDLFQNNNSKINLTSSNNSIDCAKYVYEWEERTKNTKYPSNITDEFESLVMDINTQCKVVVVNLYIPSFLRSTSKEKEYEHWLSESFLPMLHENNITYLDLSRSIPDCEFEDSTHLTRLGRENFTRQFDLAFRNLSIFE